MADPPPLLDVANLAAGYGGPPVIAEVTLQLRLGQWLGLLGANGCGKSTLLRAISGQLLPARGHVTIAGHNLSAAPVAAKQCFGFAVEGAELPEPLTPRQYFEMIGSLRRCAPDAWPEPDLPTLLGLHPWMTTQIGSCSLGTRAKIAILAALLGSPPLLILDESLNGLDPVVSWQVRQMLQRLVRSGRHAVILSTHMVEAVGAFCTDVLFMAEGRIVLRWDSTDLTAARREEGGFEAAVMARIAGAPP